MRILLLALVCLLLAPSAFAAKPAWVHGQAERVYKWTDDHGNIQYTQYPPDRREYEEVERAYPVAPGSDSAGQSGDEASSTTDGSGAAQEASDSGVTVSEQDKQNCITASNNLVLLENPITNVTYVGKEGKTVSIDEKERAARIQQAKKNIEQYCK